MRRAFTKDINTAMELLVKEVEEGQKVQHIDEVDELCRNLRDNLSVYDDLTSQIAVEFDKQDRTDPEKQEMEAEEDQDFDYMDKTRKCITKLVKWLDTLVPTNAAATAAVLQREPSEQKEEKHIVDIIAEGDKIQRRIMEALDRDAEEVTHMLDRDHRCGRGGDGGGITPPRSGQPA